MEDILSPLGSALAGATVTVTRAIGAGIFKADIGLLISICGRNTQNLP